MSGVKRARSLMRPRDERFCRELLEVVQIAYTGSDFFALDLDREHERQLVERVLWPRLERMALREKKVLTDVVYTDRRSGIERVVKLAFDTLRLEEHGRALTSATRADYLDQLRSEPHYALLLHTSDAARTRLVFMERYMALDVLAFTYAAIGMHGLPSPPAFEAFASAAWPSRCWPSRSVRTLCRQTMPRFLADRVLRLDHWQELADKMALVRQPRRRAAPARKSAFDQLLELEHETDAGGEVRSPRARYLDASERVCVRQNRGRDALDSASSSSTSSVDDSDLGWSGEVRRAERRETRHAVAQLEGDSRRGVSQTHEYSDRLRAPGAELRMRDRMSRTFAAALHVFVRCADEALDEHFTQVDLFYLMQLMNVERLGNELHAREPRLVSASAPAAQVAAQCSPHLRDAAQRVAALPHTFLLDRRDAPQRFDYACAMAYEALYSTQPAYSIVELLFDKVDVPAVLDFVQVRGWAPARQARAALVAAERATLSDARAFVERNALVYDAQLLDALGSATLQCALRVPLNVERQVVGTSDPPTSSAARAALHRSNAVTPHALQCSVRAALPGARDGLDFLVLYTPLSFIYANDPRYAHVRSAGAVHGERAHSASVLAECVAQRAVHDASEAHNADDGDAAPVSGVAQQQQQRPRKRRRGRPTKQEMLLRRKRREIDEARAQAAQRETLAEPALYVVLSERARAALQETAAPLVLLQRALGQSAINRHTPLCAPSVAHVLAHSTNLPALCHALNALSVLIGGAPREWRAQSPRSARYAVRCARLAVRVVDFYASALVGYDAPLDGSEFALYSIWRVLERRGVARAAYADARRRTKSASEASELAPHADEAFFAPLAVVLNAEQLPVAVARRSFAFLQNACVHNERLHAQTKRAEERDRERCGAQQASEWQHEPRWYTAQRRGDGGGGGGRFTTQQRHTLEERQEALWFARARTRRVDERGDGASSALCACGGVGVEDCAGMARAYAGGADELACCVCALNTVDAGQLSDELGALASCGPLMGACTYCRTRVPWRRADADRLLVASHVEIGDSAAAADGTRVGALDFVEQLLLTAETNAHTPHEPSATRAVRSALSSLCFRLRRWCSAPQQPRSVHTSKQTSRFAFESYANYLMRQQAPERAGARASLDDAAARRAFAQWRATERHRHRLRAAHRSTLDATDSLCDAAHSSAQESARREPADALAFALTSLECATFVRHRTLLSVLASLERAELADTEYGVAMRCALPHLVAPFAASGALHAYQSAFARTIDATHVPLCDAALAESTALGASALQSFASEWRRDASAKHEHMLYNGGAPRPLTGTLPLLSELAFLNWYEPGDHEPLSSDDSASTLSFHGTTVAPPPAAAAAAAVSRSSSAHSSEQ